MVDDQALAFFNCIASTLIVELTEAPRRIAPLMNMAVPKTARLVRVAFEPEIYEDDEPRSLTDVELARVVIRATHIRMASVLAPDVVVDIAAPNGESFTVRDLCNAIEETERTSRPRGEWFGGIDVHHVFFERIRLEDGVWMIGWGS